MLSFFLKTDEQVNMINDADSNQSLFPLSLSLMMAVLVRASFVVSLSLLSLSLTRCGVQAIPAAKNEVEATGADLINKYKRRADLVPALVTVVKGLATHEQETLEAVVRARQQAAKMISSSVITDQSDTGLESLTAFSSAQSMLSQSLNNLKVVLEKYPDIKSNRSFMGLQDQITGAENRIMWARKRHIEAIQKMNDLVTTPPNSWTNTMFFHEKRLQQWASDEEVSAIAPEVNMP